MEYLGLAGRLVIGLVFIVAAVPKLRDPAAFRSSVAAYKILPEALVTPVARALPPLEVAIGLMLLTGVLIVPVSVLAALVLVGLRWRDLVRRGARAARSAADAGSASSRRSAGRWWPATRLSPSPR